MTARTPLVLVGGQIQQLQSGDTLAGVSGGSSGWTAIGSPQTISGSFATVDLLNISQAYTDLRAVFSGMGSTSSSCKPQFEVSNDGVTYSAAQSFYGVNSDFTTQTFSNTFYIYSYTRDFSFLLQAGAFIAALTNPSAAVMNTNFIANAQIQCTGGVKYLRALFSAGNVNAGTFSLWGRS